MNAALFFIFTGLMIILIIVCCVYGWHRMKSEYAQADLSGEEGKVIEWHGTKGRIHVQSRVWPAFTEDPADLRPGQKIVVARVINGHLKINPVEVDVESVNPI